MSKFSITSTTYQIGEIERVNNKLIYSKNVYSPKVKIDGWRNWEITRPFDFDPARPDSIDLFRSHYRRFGNNVDEWKTTTGETLYQNYCKRKCSEENPTKAIYNVHTFIRDICDQPDPIEDSQYCQKFRTTMQIDYQIPFPKALLRIKKLEQEPFFQNKILADNIYSKFHHDAYLHRIKKLQISRKYRNASYNFCTGEQT